MLSALVPSVDAEGCKGADVIMVDVLDVSASASSMSESSSSSSLSSSLSTISSSQILSASSDVSSERRLLQTPRVDCWQYLRVLPLP